ncbi:hypothetical protein [Streptomyces sp. JJ36]|uniref:hypothetical protein n=1 Tax=Streptomyces sp. JJ36 TaxID=2736645 RepID=UPI001F485D00|nr:hypothetical protein [Streptomyces sp. JJ36]MCF6525633.1 hypothetical protein [Streptomyces sp. JJ36]
MTQDEDREGHEGPRPSRRGKGGTPNVAGSDVQQPEIAEGPVEGLEPGETVERGPWRPPEKVDPPPGYGHPPEAGTRAPPGTRTGEDEEDTRED